MFKNKNVKIWVHYFGHKLINILFHFFISVLAITMVDIEKQLAKWNCDLAKMNTSTASIDGDHLKQTKLDFMYDFCTIFDVMAVQFCLMLIIIYVLHLC